MNQQLPVFEEQDPALAPPPPPSEDDVFWGGTDPAAAAPAGERRHPVRTWLAAGIGAAVVGAAAFAGINLARHESTTLAGAGPGGGGFRPGGFGGPGRRGTNGTIASVDGSQFTVTTPAGTTVKVTTSSSTTYTASSAGSVGDIKAGDNVTVMGTTSGTTVGAERITDSGSRALADGFGGPRPGATTGNPPAGAGARNAAPPAGAQNGGFPGDGRGGPPNAGVVKSVSGTSFTLTTTAGTTLTVNTSSATAVNLVKPSSFGALKVGEQVNVNGTTGSDGTVAANSVGSGDAGFAPDGRAAR